MIGYLSLLAFGAAVMPQKWIVEIAEELGFEPFPSAPITFYLARNLSLLYGFVGCTLLVISSDLVRYRPLVRKIAIGTVLFGILQWIVDAQSGMPIWWTAQESLFAIAGGTVIAILDKKTESPPLQSTKR